MTRLRVDHHVSPGARVAIAGLTLAGVATLGGCGSSVPDPTGMWSPSDGTATKTIQANGGPCTGMYYNQGKPLDIGGGMTCTLSSQKGADGTYTMIVSQPPNQTTYKVTFTGKDVMTLSDASSGQKIVTLSRR